MLDEIAKYDLLLMNCSSFLLMVSDHGYTWHIGGKIVGLPTNVAEKYKTGDLVPGETQVGG